MKFFSVGEANALLPRLRVCFEMIRDLRKDLAHVEPNIQAARERAPWGGGSPSGQAFVRLVLQFSRLTRAIESMGVILKDVEVGLFDFPHHFEDRIVLLCWKHGEERIDWYHETDSGFAGRKPLDQDSEEFSES